MKACVTVCLVPEASGGPFVFHGDWTAALRTAAEIGFDAVELFPPDAAAINAAPLRAALDRDALPLAAVGTGAGWLVHRWTLTDPRPEIRQQAQAFIQSLIEVASQFGAPVIIGSMQGRAEPGTTVIQAKDWLRSALDELGREANRRGVTLLYEPLNRYETNLCNSLHDATQLISSLSCNNVRLLADLFHLNIEEADIADAIRAAGHWIGHVHFVDSNRQAAGQGHLDFGPILRALRDVAYAGYLSAEALPRPDSLSCAQQTMRAFRYWTRSASTTSDPPRLSSSLKST